MRVVAVNHRGREIEAEKVKDVEKVQKQHDDNFLVCHKYSKILARDYS